MIVSDHVWRPKGQASPAETGETARASLATTPSGQQDEPLAHLRGATARWVERERTRARRTTGVPALDGPLAGGWPQGKVAELCGSLSAGRTSVAMATAAVATARGELVAWLDAPNAFDPASASAAGVDLGRVLWVRPRTVEEAVRAAELLLELCGFTVVVLDVTAVAAPARRRESERKGALRLRLARAVERAGAVALVLAERPWVGTLAGVTVALGRGETRWGGGEGDSPRWLAGIGLDARIERGGARREAGEAARAAPLPFRERAAGG